MTTDHHTPYQDGVTTYEDSDMNAPLAELDAVFGGSFTGKKGKIPRVGSGESALEYFDSSYDIGGSYNGSPTGSLTIMRFPFVRNVMFEAGMSLSKMIASVAATATAIFSLRKGGVEFATATFGAGGTTATFACALNTTFTPGQILTIVAPASPDATLANLAWCLAGTRNVYTVTTTSSTTTSSTSSTTSTTTTA